MINLKPIFHIMITPPVFADEHKTHIARLLYMILWTYMLAAPLVILIGIALPETLLRWILFDGVIYATIPILLGLVRRGHTGLVSWLAILEPWGIFTALAFTAGGMHSPAVSIYPVIIFVTGLILGTKAAIITAGACSLTELGLIYAEKAGILTAGTLPHTPVSLWLANMALLAVVVGIQHVITHTIQRALQRAHQELTDRRLADKSLRESELRFYALFTDITEGACLHRFVYDKKGIAVNYEILDVNPQFEKMMNLRRKDVVHKLATEVYGTPEPPYLTEYLAAARIGPPYHFETFFAPMNKYFYVSISTMEKGRFAAILFDITERKEAEEALRASEERFKTEYQGNPIPSFTWQKKENEFVLTNYNNAAKNITREDVVKYIGKTAGEMYVDRQDILDDFHQCYREKGMIKKEVQSQHFLPGRLVALTYAFVPPDLVIVYAEDITERKEWEQKLLESEERYRVAIEYSNDGISFVKAGNHIYVNKRFLEIFGYDKPDDIIGKPTGLVVHPDYHEELKEYRRKRQEGEEAPEQFTFKGIKKDGTEIFIEASVTTTTYRGEQVLFVFSRDITERKKAKDALIRSEATLKSILLASPVGIVFLTPERETIWMNDRMTSVMGYTAEEIRNRKSRTLYLTDEEFTRVGETVFGETRRGGIGITDTKWVHKDGRTLNIHVSAAAIDPMDLSRGIVFTAIDITDRKQAEEALLKLNAELENRVVERTAELMDLYNNAPCGYHSLDENGNFILINDTELNMFGFERKEIIGRRFTDILTPESMKMFEKRFPGFKKQGRAKRPEFDIIRKDGSVLPILVNSLAVKDVSGKFLYSRSTVLDNSEHKEAEKEIKKLNEELEARAHKLQSINKELESFSYSISHDLKAPLRGIEGYSKLLLEDYADKLDADGRTFLHTICSGTAQMSQLIDDLLAYSRLERRTFISDSVLIPLFIEKLLLGYADEIESRNIKLTVALLEVVVRVDADGLGVALRNLIENAFKFTRDVPAPTIAIACNMTEEKFIIWVKDNGIGFDMAYHDRIFEIFHRLQHSEGYSGTGIGLFIARKAVERMGGRLWGESKPGKGATFYVEIPK